MQSEFANQVLDECESTNDLAKKLGELGFPSGTWVSARRQTRGRGRLGRTWQSQDGNLFLSLVARVENTRVWTWIPLAASLGVVDGLRKLYPALDVRIKWPNDIWVSGEKLCGILCEGVGIKSGSFIVIGVGLNCAVAPEVDQKTTSLSQALGKKITADDVRASVIDGIQKQVGELSENGPESLSKKFESYAALSVGTWIEWWSGVASDHKEGRVLGLGTSGELLVELENGEKLSLFAEDVKVRAK